MPRTHTLAAVALLAALVVGCSEEDPEPKFEQADSASPSPTDESTPSTTPTPSAPKQTPEQTVRAWVAGMNKALRGGEIQTALEQSTSDCSSCRDLLDPVAKVYRLGGRYETSGWQIEAIKRRQNFRSSGELIVGLSIAGGRTITSRGAKPVEYQTERELLIFKVDQSDGKLPRVALILFQS